jgi:hypothetical protein
LVRTGIHTQKHCLGSGFCKVVTTSGARAEVLAENNRLKEVPKITTTFLDIVASARGQVKALITSAQVGSPCKTALHHAAWSCR